MTVMETLTRAKNAHRSAAGLPGGARDAALRQMAAALSARETEILTANRADVEKARGTLSEALIDRLTLTPARIKAMADGILDVAALPDPVGRRLSRVTRPNGLVIDKLSVPFGVIAIIFESRPNVASDTAALALKSGNACVLRGGREAFSSVSAITDALREGLAQAGLPEDLICQIKDTSRESAHTLMTARGLVDLLIPRGGPGLIRACVDDAKVPCIETGTGICHIYVDEAADLQKALAIVDNAKTSRPSVCNACEVCLVHEKIAPVFLPLLKQRLVDDRAYSRPVELRLDERARSMIPGKAAGENDFDTEFLDYILSVKVVSDADEAIRHIARHSTGHSEAILSEDPAVCARFVSQVDSAAVYINASTRFTDGGEFGLGCEIGISTQKLHARGPMGLNELTSYQYVITGNGQTR